MNERQTITIKQACDSELRPLEWNLEFIHLTPDCKPPVGEEVMLCIQHPDSKQCFIKLGVLTGVKHIKDGENVWSVPWTLNTGEFGDIIGWQYKPKPIMMDRELKTA